jgi:hypothetical protein
MTDFDITQREKELDIRGDRIHAVQSVRQRTDLDLRSAVRIVDLFLLSPEIRPLVPDRIVRRIITAAVSTVINDVTHRTTRDLQLAIMDAVGHIPPPTPILKFFECGGCSMYHPAGFTGDCRDDQNRFHPIELDGWEEVAEDIDAEEGVCRSCNETWPVVDGRIIVHPSRSNGYAEQCRGSSKKPRKSLVTGS